MAKKKTHEEYTAELAVKNPTVEIIGEYINARTPTSHKCLIHNVIWDQIPDNALRGYGCPECRKIRVGDKNRKSSNQYKTELYTMNPNIEVIEDYIDVKTPILHMCKIDGHIWSTSPDSILQGHGCPLCGYKKLRNQKVKTHEEYIKDVENINQDIDVLGTYIDAKTPILHRCKQDGCEWMAKPNNILSGYGCPKCNASKGEKTISQWLESFKIKYIPQHRFKECRDKKQLPFDFYLPDYNICIEYDGQQHFEPVNFNNQGLNNAKQQLEKTQRHDQIKNKYCKDNNIRLLRIPYFKNIEEELNNFLFI